MNTQKIYESKIFWQGIVSVIMMIAVNYGLFDLIGLPEGKVKEIIEIIFNLIFGSTALYAVGNSPKLKDEY